MCIRDRVGPRQRKPWLATRIARSVAQRDDDLQSRGQAALLLRVPVRPPRWLARRDAEWQGLAVDLAP
eukprot:11213649-Alexandrium_andersonii.AAC.1